MNSEEQTLIDGLFTRLQEAEHEGGLRDADAEAQIKRHLARQPAAPYYMAQALLIQEAAIKRLDQRVRELEAQAAAAQRQRSGGGFLSGLFGGGQPASTPQASQRPAGWGETRFSQNAPAAQAAPAAPAAMPGGAPAAQGGGFMRGALQTAAGVAGGVMVADLLTNMFHHNQPQEIVEVIREDGPMQDSFAGGLDNTPMGDNFADTSYSNSNDIDTDAFDSSDFFDDDSMFS